MNDTTFQRDGSVKYVPVVVDAKQKPITNADAIRAMTDEELADKFSLWCCRSTTNDSYCKSFGTCDKCWLDWLKQEVDDAKD